MTTPTDTKSPISGGLPTVFDSDLDRAVDFFTTTLGLRLQHQVGEHFAVKLAFFGDCDGTELYLCEVPR